MGVSNTHRKGVAAVIREDTYIVGGENRTKVNIIYQKKMKMGPDLKKQILKELTDDSRDTKKELIEEQLEGEEPDSYTVNTLEEAIKFFTSTINLAFGTAEYNANEVTDFLLTTEDAVSAYESVDGGMFLFKYEPVTSKRKLKYYDALPLIILNEKISDGFIGLNLHYLPERYRIAFMKALFGDVDLENLTEDDMQSRLGRLSTYKFIRPTYKRYKYDGISSRLIRIPIENWALASLLPISKFQLESRKNVWADSIRMINEEERRI